MKAMIFAAGLGSRLKPLTDTMPKALVPIAGHPMLEHVILKLKAAGFTEIVINIHHFGEQILDFLEANGNNTPDPQWACVNIVNFEMGLANMRLVPLTPVAFE